MHLTQKLDLVLLVDDNEDDNFFARLALEEANITERIEAVENGEEALKFLNSAHGGIYPQPEVIFLDINMPVMNGWEFLEVYHDLPNEVKANLVVVMLTTSQNPEDLEKAQQLSGISEFMTKPLTAAMIEKLMKEHFPERISNG